MATRRRRKSDLDEPRPFWRAIPHYYAYPALGATVGGARATYTLGAAIRVPLFDGGKTIGNALAEVETSILDWLHESLPRPPFTDEDTANLAHRVYDFVWQQSEGGSLFAA